MFEVASVPVPRGNLDSATHIWVGDPFQAAENEFLKIEKNRACGLGGWLADFLSK